jgi:uncharacterized membrane protein YqjE
MFIILNLFFITLFIFIFYKVYRKCEVQAGRVLLIILGIIIESYTIFNLKGRNEQK